jgi:hypothetical protein
MNDGYRCVIERRDGKYFWQFTEHGALHEAKRPAQCLLDAAQSAEDYRGALKWHRYWRKEKERNQNRGPQDRTM